LLILKALNHVPGQITFFSLSFNFAERLLMIPNSFAGSLSVTMMAQYGRGENRMQSLTVTGAKYTLLLSMPLLIGMACVSGPVVRVVLGPAYEGMIPVLAIACVLAVPKSLLVAPTTLLQTAEKQKILIWVGCIGGALDIALDILLTPSHGAAGAAVANGVAQTVAAILIWWQVRRIFNMDLRLSEFARITLSALIMSGAVVAVWKAVPGVAGLPLSIAAGASIWFLMLRLLRAINKTDANRLLEIGRPLKGRPANLYRQIVGLLHAA
jgi:O-antigen/teichoic acid export membrane protein